MHPYNRRKFIKQSVLAGAVLSLPKNLKAFAEEKKQN